MPGREDALNRGGGGGKWEQLVLKTDLANLDQLRALLLALGRCFSRRQIKVSSVVWVLFTSHLVNVVPADFVTDTFMVMHVCTCRVLEVLQVEDRMNYQMRRSSYCMLE